MNPLENKSMNPLEQIPDSTAAKAMAVLFLEGEYNAEQTIH